ncbi:MAG: HEAT repeat domain-containing protein [Planctomycetes bacterium]|nr:HEAT repeat domain-containing protein [Planctomycetota bacterium]
MSSLRAAVTKGLEALGLTVEGDRAGLVVSDGVDGQKMVVRVDENERVVRLERTICYPVDDFSPDLSRAMDWLNQRRAGVCFAYHEAQRALLVATTWTSPSRDPSPNQLHLLVALALEAAGRDGPQLERVAEGETSWESLVEGEADDGPAPGRSEAADPPTRAFAGRADAADPSTRSLNVAHVRTTTRFMDHADGPDGEAADPPPPPRRPSGLQPTRRFEELDEYAARGAEPEPEPTPARGAQANPELTPRGGMSRTALQMAVYRVDNEKADRVDMTVGRRSLGYRAFRGGLLLALLGGGGYAVYTAFIDPFLGGRGLVEQLKGLTSGLISQPPTDQLDPRIAERQTLEGQALLVAELEDPLPDPELHRAYISRALNGVGDKVPALIEVAAGHRTVEVRARAYGVWVDQGLNADDATRMRLLRAVVEHGRHEDALDRVAVDLIASLRTKEPGEEALIAALRWAKGSVFYALVDLLGQPTPGDDAAAKRRSEALGAYLARDTAEFPVLRAMLRTGIAPPDAAARLVQGKGIEWARGEGRQQLTEFVVENPDSVAPLLRAEDEEVRLLAVELLVGAGTPAAVDRVARLGLRDAALRVRLRAARGLAQVGNAEAAWPLALALSRRDPPPEQAFVDEVRRALARLPVAACVAKLREHLAPTLPVGERYYAVVALGAVQNAGGLPALLEALKDPDAQVRRKAIDLCAELQGGGANLSSGVATFREIARSDADAGVRQVAARLYKAIVGRDP